MLGVLLGMLLLLDSMLALCLVRDEQGSVGYVVGIAGIIYRHDAAGFPNGINSIKTSNLKIYPIPVQDQLTIELPIVDLYKLEITNSLGKKVHSSIEQGDRVNVNTESLSPGLYFLHLTREGITTSSKFLKK